MENLVKGNEIVENLKSIIKSINPESNIDNIRQLNLIEDLCFTSFDILVLTEELENKFGIVLKSEEIYQLNEISKLIDKISGNIV